MNTHVREAVGVRRSYGAAAACGVALACAAYVYGALDPVAIARARLDDCVRERLEQRGGAADVMAVSVSHDGQAVSAAYYACSTQP